MWWFYTLGVLFSVGFWGYDLRHEGWREKYLLTALFSLAWPIVMPILVGAEVNARMEDS